MLSTGLFSIEVLLTTISRVLQYVRYLSTGALEHLFRIPARLTVSAFYRFVFDKGFTNEDFGCSTIALFYRILSGDMFWLLCEGVSRQELW